MAGTNTGGPQMIQRGEVRNVRELARGVQAHVCLGASVEHGSATVMIETSSPEVMKALDDLKLALRVAAFETVGRIDVDDKTWRREQRERQEQRKRERREAAG